MVPARSRCRCGWIENSAARPYRLPRPQRIASPVCTCAGITTPTLHPRLLPQPIGRIGPSCQPPVALPAPQANVITAEIWQRWNGTLASFCTAAIQQTEASKWVTCGRRPGKSYFDADAALVGCGHAASAAAGPNALRGSGPNR